MRGPFGLVVMGLIAGGLAVCLSLGVFQSIPGALVSALCAGVLINVADRRWRRQ